MLATDAAASAPSRRNGSCSGRRVGSGIRARVNNLKTKRELGAGKRSAGAQDRGIGVGGTGPALARCFARYLGLSLVQVRALRQAGTRTGRGAPPRRSRGWIRRATA